MSLAQKTIRGLKWQVVEVVGRQLLGLVVFTTLARLLDPAAFGLVGMVGVYLAFVGMFVDQGIGTALIQRKDLQPDHLHTAFWFNLGFATLVCGGTMALAGPVALLFAEPQLEPLLRWASLGLVLGALGNIHSTVFMREMDFKRPAMRVLIAQLAGGAVGVTMAFLGYGVWALIGQQLVAALAGTIFLWIASTYRPRLTFSAARLRELFGMSSAVFATSVLWFISSRADQFFIGRFLGATTLGLYTTGAKLPEITRSFISTPVTKLSLPAFSSVQSNRHQMAQGCYVAMSFLTLVTFPCFIGLAAIAPNLVHVLFGHQWAGSIPLLQLLAIYSLCTSLQTLFHPLLLSLQLKRQYLIVNCLNAAGGVIAGAIGASLGVSILILLMIGSIVATGILSFCYIKSHLPITARAFWRPALAPALASLVMGSVILAVGAPDTGVLWLVVKIVIGISVFAIVLRLVEPTRLREMSQVFANARLTSPHPEHTL